MEYKLFKLINKRTPKNILIRRIIYNFLFIIGFFIIIIPLPFSVPTGLLLIVLGLIIKIRTPQNLRYLVKLKKSILHLFKNYKNKKRIKQKIKDIKRLYNKL